MEKTIKINNFAENLASLLNVKIGQSFRICGTGLGLWYRIVEVPKVTVQTYDCYNDEWRESVLKLVEFVELVHRNGIVIEDRLRNGDICYIPNFSVAKGYNKYKLLTVIIIKNLLNTLCQAFYSVLFGN